MTNNRNIYRKADHLSQNAKIFHKWKYEYNDLGYNIKMPKNAVGHKLKHPNLTFENEKQHDIVKLQL